MTQNINPLITSLYTGSIKKAEFLKRYFNGKIYTDKSVLDLIEKGITNKDKIIIEENELCHLVVPYHNAAFYELQTRLIPDWKNLKKKLDLSVWV